MASPIATTEGLDRVVLDGPSAPLSVTVLPVLAGDWLDVNDRAAVLSAGACLAKVHQALGAAHDGALPTATRTQSLRERIDQWLANRDRGYAPEASLRLEGMLSGSPELDDEPQMGWGVTSRYRW